MRLPLTPIVVSPTDRLQFSSAYDGNVIASFGDDEHEVNMHFEPEDMLARAELMRAEALRRMGMKACRCRAVDAAKAELAEVDGEVA